MRKIAGYLFCAFLSVLVVVWVACGWWDGSATSSRADSLLNRDSYVHGSNFLRSDSPDTMAGHLVPATGATYHLGRHNQTWDTVFASNINGSTGSFLNSIAPKINHMGSIGLSSYYWQWGYIDTIEASQYNTGIAYFKTGELYTGNSKLNDVRLSIRASRLQLFANSTMGAIFTYSSVPTLKLKAQSNNGQENGQGIGDFDIEGDCIWKDGANVQRLTFAGNERLSLKGYTGTEVISVDTNRVGILTTIPSQVLDVNGNIDCDTVFGITLDTIYTVASLCIYDTLATGTNLTPPLTPPQTVTIDSIYAVVNTAPTGDTIKITVDKNGVSIHPGTVLMILATATTSNTVVPDTTTASWKDLFTIDINKVGSTLAGIDLSVFILCHYVQ